MPNAPLWFKGVDWLGHLGEFGVPLFFVISGFCIHLRLASDRPMGFLEFWKRRFNRLYPPYLVALCISMLLVYGAYRMGMSGLPLIDRYPDPKPKWMLVDLFLHVTMLHGVSETFDTLGGNGAYWSLAREEYFYALYFALIFFRRRIGTWKTLCGVLALGLCVTGWYGNGWTPKYYFAIVLWFQWCMGMVAVDGYYGKTKIPAVFKSWYTFAALGIGALLTREYAVGIWPYFCGLAFFTLLNIFVEMEQAGKWPNKNMVVAWLTRVGVFSYSLYLIHNSVIKVSKQLLKPLTNTQNPVVYTMIALVMCVMAYWVARVYFWAIESRFLTPKKRELPTYTGNLEVSSGSSPA